MKEYVGRGWAEVLRLNELESFESIWNLDVEWFEELNERRGGWSGVSRINLLTENGKSVGVFLKRQENHNTKGWTAPVKGVPTFYKEFKNILRFVSYGLPAVEPVFFSHRYKDGNSQAILMTRELDGFESLASAIYSRDSELMQDKVMREQMMLAVAGRVREMHDYHFEHGCLYDKHIFVRFVEGAWEVVFIDLEKLRRTCFQGRAVVRDLYTLAKYAKLSGWRRSDRLGFLKDYMKEESLSSRSKLIWRKINRRMKLKNKI